MSVINRMLEDLERRQDGPGDDRPADKTTPPGLSPESGHGRYLVIAVAVGVALLVLAVGGLAWRAAGDLSLPAAVETTGSGTGNVAEDTTMTATVEQPGGEPAEPAPAKPPRPVLREADTLIKPSGARVALTFDRPLAELPVVRHDNRRTDFWLPDARLDGNALAFLAGLKQAGRVEANSDADGTSLSIEPADGTRLDVEADRQGIVLAFTSSGPASSAPSPRPVARAQASAPAAETRASDDSPDAPNAEPAQASAPEKRDDENTTETMAGSSDRAADRVDEGAPPSMGIRPATKSMRQQVRQQLAEGNAAAARSTLETALAEDPSRQDLWRLLATLDMREGADGQAVSRLSGVADPAPATLALLGLAARRAERPEAAVGAYARALETHPERADWWAGLGIAMESAGRPARAGSAYRRALSAQGLSRELRAYVERRLAALRGNASAGAD